MTQTIEAAAKYFLKYNGMRGNAKQVAQMIRTTPALAIIRMATERGWKPETVAMSADGGPMYA